MLWMNHNSKSSSETCETILEYRVCGIRDSERGFKVMEAGQQRRFEVRAIRRLVILGHVYEARIVWAND